MSGPANGRANEPADGEDLADVMIEDPAWLAVMPDFEVAAAAAVRLAFEAAGLDPDRFSVSILACQDQRIAALNGDFRGRAEPTNVLSWPAFALCPIRPGGLPPAPPAAPPGRRQTVGDVAVALQTARAEAEALGIPLKDHVIHLILHGCLHSLGFGHETEEDAETMEGIETRALARIGIPDPYRRGGAGGPHPD